MNARAHTHLTVSVALLCATGNDATPQKGGTDGSTGTLCKGVPDPPTCVPAAFCSTLTQEQQDGCPVTCNTCDRGGGGEGAGGDVCQKDSPPFCCGNPPSIINCATTTSTITQPPIRTTAPSTTAGVSLPSTELPFCLSASSGTPCVVGF